MADVTPQNLPSAGTLLGTDLVIIGRGDNAYKSNITTLANFLNSTYLTDVVQDATPQLGGNLDANGAHILFPDNTGIHDNNNNELIRFRRIAAAANYFEIWNSITANRVRMLATGSDTNVGVTWATKGTGNHVWEINSISEMVMDATNFYPFSNDGQALGRSGNAFADLFLASGAVINFAAGDVLITHSANTLTFSGASSGYNFDAIVSVGGNPLLRALDFTAWTAYTPSFTTSAGAFGTAPASGRWFQVGKTVFFSIEASITTQGGVAGGRMQLSLPVVPVGSNMTCSAVDSTARLALAAYHTSGGTLEVTSATGGYPGANGKVFYINGCYEVA